MADPGSTAVTAAGGPAPPPKPLDFGNGRIAGSVARDGGLLMVGFHSTSHGYVTLECATPFADENRGDQAAVRRYRAGLADVRAPSLRLGPDEGWTVTALAHREGIAPTHRLRCGSLQAELETVALSVNGEALGVVVQRWRFTSTSVDPVAMRLVFEGTLRLGRAALTQLTEGGVLPAGASRHVVRIDAETLTVTVPDLGLEAVMAGLPHPALAEVSADESVRLRVPVDVRVDAERRLDVAVAVGVVGDDLRTAALQGLGRDTGAVPEVGPSPAPELLRQVPDTLQPVVRRAVAYVRSCCVVPTDAGCCLVTDHRILPLSWTRDAYYAARMLLVCGLEDGPDIVQRHLRWLFRTARRPDGFFARSYMTSGAVKDRAFQLDQQCYPILELAQYVEVTGDVAVAGDCLPTVQATLAEIDRRRHPDRPLFATDETPGDDPLDLPYHFSSHVLLWYTLTRLQRLSLRLSLDGTPFEELAAAVRTAATAAFAVDGPEGRHFAYAVDLAGRSLRYHDANDLPTVLAPLWGFCGRDDPLWQATMRFAFSVANQAGYFPGPFGGLGSVHTPGPWPLGDVQELVYARIVGDADRERAVVDRLAATACVDGALPEARDATTGEVRSRHWFAWPGAALTLALVDPSWQPPEERAR